VLNNDKESTQRNFVTLAELATALDSKGKK
jgi:hypothetical protein